MRTLEEIMSVYMSEYNEQENKKNAFNQKANQARLAAMRYYSIAARKMSEYEKHSMNANMCYVKWTEALVKPLVEEVNRRTGLDFDCSDLRTYGLGCECPVFTNSKEQFASLTFTPNFGNYNEGVRLQLYSGETTNRYSVGSIGELNGGNNVVEDVVSVETVIENIKRNYPNLNL